MTKDYNSKEKRALHHFKRAEERQNKLGEAVLAADICPYVSDMITELNRLKENILFAYTAGVLAKADKCLEMVREYIKKVHTLHILTYKAIYA